ncbi:MAG: SusC/RagA family TonB-linked outer membrane protein, partial [Bacteroidota bacterium]|nr:SusC/RagA family TonB-linked outer membrane protein [Bacteroidota bacterium]
MLASVLFFTSSWSQGRTVTGTVMDEKNSPLSGATVTAKGTTVSTSTNAEGAFKLQVSAATKTLVISFVGMQTKEVSTGSGSGISIALTANASTLNDVVVVGYGRMKKSDMSSAVLTISSADIEKTVNTTLDQALQGKSPNVYVSQSSGAPGAGASVIIRGVSTVTGNSQPLYVIDGVQIRPSMSRGGAYQTGGGGAANELAGLNPEDIESMSVLMGPAATSIYGAAGANGVLVITTKQGKSGATRVNVTSAQTIQTRPRELPVMDLQQWAKYRLKMQQYGLVGYNPPEIMDPSLLGAGTNWQNELFRNTLMQKYSLSLSGGSEKSTFYISGDYLTQNGVAVGSGFNRGSIRMNLINTVNQWLKFNTNLNSFVTKEKVNTYQANIINMALQQNPSIPVKTPNGSFGGPATPQEAQYAITNPIAIAQLNNNYNTSFGVIGGLSMDVTPLKGLVWHTEANGNYTFANYYSFNPSYSLGAYYTNPNTTGSRSASNNYWISLNTRVQYDHTIGKHSMSAMLGHEAQYYAYQSLSASGTRFSTNSIQELSVADPLSAPGTSDRGNGANESYFSRLNYTYNDRYIAQFVVRRDGSSNFGPANRFGTFPAASLAWKISDEKFMQGMHFIN